MALVSVIFWAVNYPATRYVLPYYSPGSLSMLRFFIASIILTVFAVIKKSRLPDKKDLLLFVFNGFAGIFLFAYFLNTGVRFVASGVASFIINSAPVFTLVLARLFLKEIVKPACWIGIFISFFGLAAIMLSQTVGFSLNIGVFLLLIAAISNSVYNVVQRILLRKYTFLETVTFSMIPANLFLFIFIPDVVRDLSSSPPPLATLIVVLMGFFPGAIAYLSWGYALSIVEKTTHVTVFLYLVPFLATLMGFLWLDETMTIWAFIGGVAIIAGMVLTNTLGKAR